MKVQGGPDFYVRKEQDIVVVPDATVDRRFADNPQVVGEPHLRLLLFLEISNLLANRGNKFPRRRQHYRCQIRMSILRMEHPKRCRQ